MNGNKTNNTDVSASADPEIDMFLGNILVKEIMPPMHQTDIDKLTAHGFDAKTSL